MGIDTDSKKNWNWRIADSRSQRRVESFRTKHSWHDETEEAPLRQKPESGILIQLIVHVGQGGIPYLKPGRSFFACIQLVTVPTKIIFFAIFEK